MYVCNGFADYNYLSKVLKIAPTFHLLYLKKNPEYRISGGKLKQKFPLDHIPSSFSIVLCQLFELK